MKPTTVHMNGAAPSISGQDDEPLLTPADVARRLNVRIGWVYARIQAGELASIRLGKYVRIAPAALRTYIVERAGR